MGPPAPDQRPPRVRLFVALALPRTVGATVASWTRSLLGADPVLRIVPAESLHVTLAFIGLRDPGDVDRIAASVSAAVAGHAAPLLRPAELAALPVRRPRVLALDLRDDVEGRTAAVQRALTRALAGSGLYEPESRPFRPHLTVARVRKGARPGAIPPPPSPPPIEPFEATEVVLYRSELHPDGARYTGLASAHLIARQA